MMVTFSPVMVAKMMIFMINHNNNPVDESLEIVEISSELESTISNEKRDHGAPM